MKNKRLIYTIGILLFFLLCFLSLFTGTKALSFTEGIRSLKSLFNGEKITSAAKVILLKIRLPRLIGAAFCGAALSASGLILQISLNNRLASPGIIGINSGSGLFVLLVTYFFPYSAIARMFGAFTGALICIFIVYFISEKAGVSKTTLVLAGVAVSSLMSAGIDILITLHPEIVADKVSFNLGGFQNINIKSLFFAPPIIIAALVVLLMISEEIDLFSLGDEAAYGLGLNVKRYRILSIVISGILAASAVSICGLLGFVGLIIPNLIRLFSKNKISENIILSIIFGADFLIFCDLISRILFYPYELPVGLFLSCLGSPFFIWILITKRKKLGV
ncbi:MAG: iron ABC transporter permease [Treponema sp.]|nr:iron ABC transporter permease [Treponema sp.]